MLMAFMRLGTENAAGASTSPNFTEDDCLDRRKRKTLCWTRVTAASMAMALFSYQGNSESLKNNKATLQRLDQERTQAIMPHLAFHPGIYTATLGSIQ